MHYLTLSRKDRAAIDWIGFRYAHGDDLRRVLETECRLVTVYMTTHFAAVRHASEFENGDPWNSDEDLTFDVPESAAWNVKSLIEEDGMACFSPQLVKTFTDFVSDIV